MSNLSNDRISRSKLGELVDKEEISDYTLSPRTESSYEVVTRRETWWSAADLCSVARALTLRKAADQRGFGPVLETVTGPLSGSKVRWALGHEHFFADFFGPYEPGYMNVNWGDVTGACVNCAAELRAQGVDLVIDWTNIGLGRNALLLREVSRRTGLRIVCATGIYKSLTPPQFAKSSVGEIANHFYSELTSGIDGTAIRAGWVKMAQILRRVGQSSGSRMRRTTARLSISAITRVGPLHFGHTSGSAS